MKLYTILLCLIAFSANAQELYMVPKNTETGWSSFENMNGLKGNGGKENNGAKGHPADVIKPYDSVVLLNTQGAGIITRMWLTLSDRSPEMLRSIRIEMYWDGATKPAVSVPIGDFFGLGLGLTTPFQNALFSNPEGRSFNCNIPMPFRKGAKIKLVNESGKSQTLFYDVNFLKKDVLPADALYFHAYWNRNTNTKLGEDFEILPRVTGRGRFLGTNMGIITDRVYGNSWWGEGEVKMYVNGDTKFATLAGTGTEDYIGTAWGQGAYVNQFQGCPVADTTNKQWLFYRYHIPDPVYFATDLKVVIQQMGGDGRDNVRKIVAAGAKLIPVTVSQGEKMIKLFESKPIPQLMDENFPDGWTNFYRLDNYSSTAYFYLDKPVSNLNKLAPLKDRLEGLVTK